VGIGLLSELGDDECCDQLLLQSILSGHALRLEMTHLLQVINSTSPEEDLIADTAQFLNVTLVFELFLSDQHNFLSFGCVQILFPSFLR
jgi:hypothetical protein